MIKSKTQYQKGKYPTKQTYELIWSRIYGRIPGHGMAAHLRSDAERVAGLIGLHGQRGKLYEQLKNGGFLDRSLK